MTSLSVTLAEPLGDILAQLRCLCDLSHVKRAVWVSAANGLPPVVLDMACCSLPAGWLFASARLCRRLAGDPSEEELARILGYIECKSAVGAERQADLPVVQALTGDGWVVWEQLSSWSRVGAARAVAARYGLVRVVGMAACLARRGRLIAEEVSDAA